MNSPSRMQGILLGDQNILPGTLLVNDFGFYFKCICSNALFCCLYSLSRIPVFINIMLNSVMTWELFFSCRLCSLVSCKESSNKIPRKDTLQRTQQLPSLGREKKVQISRSVLVKEPHQKYIYPLMSRQVKLHESQGEKIPLRLQKIKHLLTSKPKSFRKRCKRQKAKDKEMSLLQI